MGSRSDPLRRRFGPLREKTLKNALSACIGRDFPRLGGARLRGMLAQMLMEVFERHCPPLERVAHGQVVWMTVPVDDPPRRHQRIADATLVPVVLDLSTVQDVDRLLDREPATLRLQERVVRLCHQAYAQGGLLSNCDLSMMMHVSDSHISHALNQYEDRTGQVVPRRATLHDVGTGLTHKRIICLLRYAKGKEPHVIAKETWHSLEAVDRYLGQFDRVRSCRKQGFTPQQTAHALACSARLVEEYLRIDDELATLTKKKRRT
jgi:hypothetical protein